MRYPPPGALCTSATKSFAAHAPGSAHLHNISFSISIVETTTNSCHLPFVVNEVTIPDDYPRETLPPVCRDTRIAVILWSFSATLVPAMEVRKKDSLLAVARSVNPSTQADQVMSDDFQAVRHSRHDASWSFQTTAAKEHNSVRGGTGGHLRFSTDKPNPRIHRQRPW